MFQRNELSAIRQQENVILLLHAFALNNDAVEDAGKIIKGDSTEVALMEVAIEQNIQPDIWSRLAEIPFDADRKMMTTFHAHENKFISFTDIFIQCIEASLNII